MLKQNTGIEMAAPQKIVLRVYIATDMALKLTLNERPKSVEELKSIMQEKFKPRLDSDFSLQYEDPDFDGQLSLLVDIEELPEKGTLKVVRSESDDLSTASSDTDIRPHVPLTKRQKNWPDTEIDTIPKAQQQVLYHCEPECNYFLLLVKLEISAHNLHFLVLFLPA